MPHLFKKSFVRPKSAPSSQSNKISKFKSFKTPLVAKENIDKILQLNGTLQEANRPAYYSQTSLKAFEKDQIIASSASSLEIKKRNLPQLKRTSSNASSMSMHLSFEDASEKVIDDSDKSDISNRMNEPKIKDAYLQFVKKLSQSSSECKLTSSPKSSEDIVLPHLTQRSPDMFATPKNSSLKENNETEQSLIIIKENKKASRKIKKPPLDQNDENESSPPKRAKKNNGNETMSKKKNNIKGISRDEGNQSEEKTLTLSQEVLNQTGVKAAYVNFMKSSLENEEDIIKPRTRKANRKKKKNVITSSGEESLSESLDKAKKTKSPTKRNKIPKRKYEEIDNNSNLTVQERMALIQESRNVGLYVLCDICNKARYLPNVKDPLDLPDKWYCAMHPDEKYNKCSYPEEILEDKDYLIDNLYNAGSIVWAKMDGYPWWPAMVEDDVDTETYFWLDGNSMAPAWYHVTFFDVAEVTRAWMRPSCLKPFKTNMKNPTLQTPEKNRYKSRVSAAIEQAVDATYLPSIDRLKKYSFVFRYKKPLNVTRGNTSNIPEKRIKKTQGSKKAKKKLIMKQKINISKEMSRSPAWSLQNQPIKVIYQSDVGMPAKADDLSVILNDLNWTDTQNLSFNLLD